MKKVLSYILAVCAVAILLSTFVVAQNDKGVSRIADTYVISAKAGGVNYVEGKIAVLRKNGTSGYLIKGDTLQVGDKVSTGTGGKAEILLNPGSYIRLSEKADFEFVTTSLDDLTLKLTRGSAMLEVYADNEFKVAVKTPKAEFYAVKSGVYRVDVLDDGTGVISVWKGRALLNDAGIVKAGSQASVNGNNVAINKFDRDDKDALEVWSKARAKELAKLNARLERNDVRRTLLSSYNRGGWGLYDSFGLWVYDPFMRTFCFLPFGYGWNSPYGYYYKRDIWYYQLPPVIYIPPHPNPNGNGNTTNTPIIRNTRPPFESIQNDVGTTPRGRGRNGALDNDSSFPSMNPPPAPVFVPPPSSSVPTKSSKEP